MREWVEVPKQPLAVGYKYNKRKDWTQFAAFEALGKPTQQQTSQHPHAYCMGRWVSSVLAAFKISKVPKARTNKAYAYIFLNILCVIV